MMRYLAGMLAAAGVMVAAATAWGQMGLVGSPEILRLPEVSRGWEHGSASMMPGYSSGPSTSAAGGSMQRFGPIVPVAGQQASEVAADTPALIPAGIVAAEPPAPVPDLFGRDLALSVQLLPGPDHAFQVGRRAGPGEVQ